MSYTLSNELKCEIEALIKKDKIFNINKEENLSNDEFNIKLKQGYNYPLYPNNKIGKNLLIYIREYLIKKKNNKRKNLYPPYIKENLINAENLKRYFRKIACNYIIDKDDNLYYKYFIKQNNYDNKSLEKENKIKEYIPMKIPFKKNILEYR